MRYTEAKLTRFAKACCPSWGRARWTGCLTSTAPARTQSLTCTIAPWLLNGTTGIAVGMATDIPPHNVREVVGRLCVHAETAQCHVAEVAKFIKGPDYPTEAEIITPQDEIKNIYATGNGSIRMRAKWDVEDGEIVLSALPHQVSAAKVLGANRQADAGQEITHGGRPAR